MNLIKLASLPVVTLQLPNWWILLMAILITIEMELKDGKQAVQARTRVEWREWLAQNSQSEKFVWLIMYHKKSEVHSINYNDAMEEALCFGWIDSKAKKRDAESFYLTFTPRNPKSKWSKPNRERVEKMVTNGLMTEHGQKLIDTAIQTGKWESVEAITGSDLQKKNRNN